MPVVCFHTAGLGGFLLSAPPLSGLRGEIWTFNSQFSAILLPQIPGWEWEWRPQRSQRELLSLSLSIMLNICVSRTAEDRRSVGCSWGLIMSACLGQPHVCLLTCCHSRLRPGHNIKWPCLLIGHLRGLMRQLCKQCVFNSATYLLHGASRINTGYKSCDNDTFRLHHELEWLITLKEFLHGNLKSKLFGFIHFISFGASVWLQAALIVGVKTCEPYSVVGALSSSSRARAHCCPRPHGCPS